MFLGHLLQPPTPRNRTFGSAAPWLLASFFSLDPPSLSGKVSRPCPQCLGQIRGLVIVWASRLVTRWGWQRLKSNQLSSLVVDTCHGERAASFFFSGELSQGSGGAAEKSEVLTRGDLYPNTRRSISYPSNDSEGLRSRNPTKLFLHAPEFPETNILAS